MVSACIEHNQRGSKEGYGSAQLNGRSIGMHRKVFYLANGYLPEVVRHTCDNSLCINPGHLVAGTPQDNSQDMVDRGRSIRGTSHKLAKLTPDSIREILRLRSAGTSLNKLASRFNVARGTITSILSGRTWSFVK